jgi:hypothetical protein
VSQGAHDAAGSIPSAGAMAGVSAPADGSGPVLLPGCGLWRARGASPASLAASGLLRSATRSAPVRALVVEPRAGSADWSSACRGLLGMATWGCAVTHFRVTPPAAWGVVEPGEETSHLNAYKGSGSAGASTSHLRLIGGRYMRES